MRKGLLIVAFVSAGFLASACGSASPTLGGSGVSPTPVSSSTLSEPAADQEPCPPGAGLPAGAADHGSRAASGGAVRTAADDFYFEPTCLTGVRAGAFSITVTNSGSALHNFSLPAQGIDQDVAPGQHITVTVQVGTVALQFFCKYHRASGMVGAILSGTVEGR